MIKRLLFKMQNRIWFVPSFYSIIAIVLAMIAIILDNEYPYMVQSTFPRYLLTDSSLAKTILATLVSSLLTMTTITFSTIMVVLTTYSSQFSPRTLEDFITNKTTLRVLGIFMGGFIYSILTLFFVKERPDNKLVFSAALGVIISIICLAFFVFFIHYISISIQVNRLINSLSSDILGLINKIEKNNNLDDRIQNELRENIKLPELERYWIFSRKNGYIQLIDDIGLLSLAQSKKVVIRVEKMIGDYVTTNSNIISVWNNKKPVEDEAEYLKYINIGNQRNMLQDIEFGLQKIVEVALRALSPGINDPNTAILCINELGMILTRIGTANIENTYYYDTDGNLRLIFEDKSFDELLYKTFYQLRHYISDDISVISAMIDSLILIAQENKKSLRDKVWKFSTYILSAFDISTLDPLDKKYINKKIKRLAYLTNNLDCVDYFE